jgi:hypothetical protein
MNIYLLKISLDLPPRRIRQPSKRQQGLDPVVPLTPAPPKITQQRQRQQLPKTPIHPNHPSSFTARQIQQSQNRTAARVLFTPLATQQLHPHFAPPPPPAAHLLDSPTPLQRHVSTNQLGSDVEDEVRAGLERLDLAQSGSQSSGSGSQSPRAGPHSKARKVPSKSKGGAQDVWTCYEKSENNRHRCLFCK